MSKIFSVDAEVDGLLGRAFAIAVTIREGGREVAQFVGRVPDELVADQWVRENVLPALVGMEVTHTSSDEREEAFWEFYSQNALVEGKWGPSPDPQCAVIAHCGSPVESGLFRRCAERVAGRTFQGPMPLHEVGTVLLALGEDPSSVDGYNKKLELAVPFDGVAHHPMYDAVAAAVAWEDAMVRIHG